MKRITEVSNTERQDQICAYLQQSQRASVEELVAHFAISPATARRDLEALEQQGKVRRVHGGAVARQSSPPEAPVLERSNEQSEAKERIGRAAAGLVQDGETVFLSSGTTVLAVAAHLRQRQRLTVITNSLPALNALAGAPGVTLICLGGELRHAELSLIGPLTEQALANLSADRVIFGVRGIHLSEGLTNAYLQESVTDRALLRLGRQVTIVADHTKLGAVATVRVAPLSAMHTLVTDLQAPAAFLDALRARGIQVLVA